MLFFFNNAQDDFQGSCDSEEVSELRGAKQLQLGRRSSRRRRQRLVVHRKHLRPGKFLFSFESADKCFSRMASIILILGGGCPRSEAGVLERSLLGHGGRGHP